MRGNQAPQRRGAGLPCGIRGDECESVTRATGPKEESRGVRTTRTETSRCQQTPLAKQSPAEPPVLSELRDHVVSFALILSRPSVLHPLFHRCGSSSDPGTVKLQSPTTPRVRGKSPRRIGSRARSRWRRSTRVGAPPCPAAGTAVCIASSLVRRRGARGPGSMSA